MTVNRPSRADVGRWKPRSWWSALLPAVVLLLVLGLLRASPSRPTAAGVQPAGEWQLQGLPLRAQGEISSALGADRVGVSARRVGADFELAGGGLTARVTGRALTVRSPAGTLGLTLANVGRVGEAAGLGLRGLTSRALTAHRNRVVVATPSVNAWYASGPLGIEQGFTVRRRPGPGRGDLAVRLALGGALRAQLFGGTVRLLTASGEVALRYGGLRAVDASGRTLASRFVLHGRTLTLAVDDRGARYPVKIDPFVQQGTKFVPSSGEVGNADFGFSAALSADGNTAVVGGYRNNSTVGSAWVFTRSGGQWTQQAQLTGAGEQGDGYFGSSVALSADGNTVLIGGEADNSFTGAAWIFTRSGSTWTQYVSSSNAEKLTAAGESGTGDFGNAVALSADGTSALIAASGDTSTKGAVYAFHLVGTQWVQEQKLSMPVSTYFGNGLGMSADGSTAVIGDNAVNSYVGAAYAYAYANGVWTQQAPLLPTDESGEAGFGDRVSVSANGNTAIVGGYNDNSQLGAVWVFTRSGTTWSQQGPKLTPVSGSEVGNAQFGSTVTLSGDGNTAVISDSENSDGGAVWEFQRSGTTWAQQGAKLIPSDETAGGLFGSAIALSADGATALITGEGDNSDAGAAWMYTDAPVAQTAVATGPTVSGATANGTLAAGAGSSVSFDYGTSTAYGSQTPAQTIPSSGTATAVTAALSGLAPGTTYHYQLVATNSAGTSDGGDQTFTTAPATESTTTSTPTSTTSTVVTTTPVAVSSTRTTTVTIGDLQVRGVTPALNLCTAARGKLKVVLSDKTLARGTKYRFARVAVYVGSGVAHRRRERVHGKLKTVITYTANVTVKRLPRTLELSLKGLKAGTHRLRLVVTATGTVLRHHHRVRVTVHKTVTTTFTVC